MTSIRSALVVAGISIALLGVAAPAHAAGPALPAGETLVAASCLESDVTLFEVNSASGASVAIGTGNADHYCAYAASWDPITEALYGTVWDDDSILVKWDTLTGALVEIGAVVDESSNPINVDTMTIGLDGTAYILAFNELYELDLTTGIATDLGTLAGLTDSAYGSSVDPSTGLIYALQEDGDLLLIDPDAVTATYVASWTFSADGNNTYGLAIDSAGIAWVVEYPGELVYSALYSTPLATFGVAPVRSGDIVDTATGEDFVGWWVTLIPTPVKPALAATGVDYAPIAATALALGLVGLVLVARRRTA